MTDIIIVEDNREVGGLLRDFLEKEGYNVMVAESGEQALELFEQYGAKLIILDIMLQGINGFDVCTRIRRDSDAHILIASARTAKEDKLKGLDLGADDYIEKPYDLDILLAKIKGIFKRNYGVEELTDGDIRLDLLTQTIYLKGQSIVATSKEFDLLRLLMEHKGVTLKKEYLFQRVWGCSESEPQTLTVHIKWLRDKLEDDPKHPVHILTKWGVGYRYE